MTSMALVKNFIRSGRCQRPPLLSTIFYHASRIDGGGFDELFVEPARLTRALLDQHRLFQTDAVAVRFDEVAFAQNSVVAIDWAAPIPVVDWEATERESGPLDDESTQAALAPLVDVVGRLAKELRRQVPVMAIMPGPSRMGAMGGSIDGPESAARLLRGVADRVCQAGANIVMLEEDDENGDEEKLRALIAPIVNTVRYYNAFSILALSSVPTKRLADAVLLSEEAWKAGDSTLRSRGIKVPASCFESAAMLDDFKARLRAGGASVFLSVGDDIVLDHSTESAVEVHKSLGESSFA